MKGLVRSLARGVPVKQSITKVAVPVRDLVVNVVDGAPGWGTAVLMAGPVGNVLFLGAVAYLQFATDDADVIATFDGDFSLGSAPTADGALAGAEVDIIGSTPLGAATAKVSPVVRGASTDAMGGGIFDNTDGSLELNLNLLIDDLSIAGAAAFTVNGVVHLSYIVLGDD